MSSPQPLATIMAEPQIHVRARNRDSEQATGIETISTNPLHETNFRHPAFPASTNRLITLPALDHPDGGIHHGTAHTACAIIAGNRFDGYLATSPDGPPIVSSPDTILTGSDYFFCVPGPDDHDGSQPYNYPVVQNFREWCFPHHKVPPTWLACCAPKVDYEPTTASDFSDTAYLRNGSCRMSGSTDDCKIAHVCRLSDYWDWFPSNNREQYSFNNDPYLEYYNCDDPANLLHLHADLRTSFPDRNFAFVPKAGRMVVHLLTPDEELVSQYHNVPLLEPHAVAPQYLLARFAQCILSAVSDFWCMGVPRRVLENNIGLGPFRSWIFTVSPEGSTRTRLWYEWCDMRVEHIDEDDYEEESEDGDSEREGDR